MAAPRKKLTAVTSFVCEVGGQQRLVMAGEAVTSTDPILKGHAELFEPSTAPTTVRGN